MARGGPSCEDRGTGPPPVPRRSLRRAALLATIALALQGALVALYLHRERSPNAGGLGLRADRLDGREPAPALELLGTDGRPMALADLRGRFVLVHFWASWCPPCRRELPALLEAYGPRADAPLTLLLVATRDDRAAIERFWGGHVPAPVVLDPSGDGARRFGVTTLPDTFLVSPDGHLLARYRGPEDWSSDAVRQHLDRSLHPTR